MRHGRPQVDQQRVQAKKDAGRTFITIPKELLPDVIELITDAYVELQRILAKKADEISTLQYDNSELRNRIRAVRVTVNPKEEASNDNF